MNRTASETRSLEQLTELTREEPKAIGKDLVGYLRDYAREQPDMAALWCLGIGFVLGWKLRPW